MLFTPKKFKYKKEQKGTSFNKITAINDFSKLKFGNIGLKVISFSRITSKQLITLKQSIKKIIKKKGKVKINAFSATPITTKAIGVRMGKGKGNVNHWIFKARPGFILCEISTKFLLLAVKALIASKNRIPIFTKIIFF